MTTTTYKDVSGTLQATLNVNADGSGSFVDAVTGETLTFLAGTKETVTQYNQPNYTSFSIALTAPNGLSETVGIGTGTFFDTLNLKPYSTSFTSPATVKTAALNKDGSINFITTTNIGAVPMVMSAAGSLVAQAGNYSIGTNKFSFTSSLYDVPNTQTQNLYLDYVTLPPASSTYFNTTAGLLNFDKTTGTLEFVHHYASAAYPASYLLNLATLSATDQVTVKGTEIDILNSAGKKLESIVDNEAGNVITETTYKTDGTVANINQYTAYTGDLIAKTYGTTTIGSTNYTDNNGKFQADANINSDGSGYIATVEGDTFRFAAGNTIAGVDVYNTGAVTARIKTANGTIVTLGQTATTASSIYISTFATPSYNSVAVDYKVTDFTVDASGNVTATGPLTGFSTGDKLVVSTNGTSTFSIGTDTLSFAGGILSGINVPGAANPNNGFTFSMLISGYVVADISWNPTTGKALLNNMNGNAIAYSSSLGYINPGDTLKAGANGLIAHYDASGHILNSIQMAGGSNNEVDTNYNADGTVASVYTYNYKGTLVSLVTHSGGVTQTYTYDTAGNLQAREQVNVDGSGFVATSLNNTFRFANGDTVSGVHFDTSGNGTVTLKLANQNVVTFTQSSTRAGASFVTNNYPLSIEYKVDDFNVDAIGNVTATSRLNGFNGGDKLVFNTNGTAAFSVGTDTLNFAAGTLLTVASDTANPANGFVFNLSMADTTNSLINNINWNAATGKATFNITNVKTGQVFSSFIGYIDPDSTLKVLSKSSIGIFNAAGRELNSITINSDGSQVDTAYNADGTVAGTYSYDSTGKLTAQTGYTQYLDSNKVKEAFSQTATDGSGYLYAVTENETLRFAAGSTLSGVSVASTQNEVVATVKTSTGITDSFDFTVKPATSNSPKATQLIATVNGHSFVDGDAAVKDINVATSGALDITAAVGTFGLSHLVYNADGTASYTLGQDKITFAANTLVTAVGNAAQADVFGIAALTSGPGVYFQLKPASSSLKEYINWDPATGQAKLVVITSVGSQVSLGLGQINPGDVLSASGSTFTLSDASGKALNKTTVNIDGSSTSIVYNTDGTQTSRSWDNTGTQTAGPGLNGILNFYDTNKKLEAIEQINADGTGYVLPKTNPETVRFVKGDTVTSVNVDTSGNTVTTVKASNGIVDTININTTALTNSTETSFNVNGHALVADDLIKDMYVDANGNIQATAAVAGFGLSNMVLNTDGTDSYSIGSDTISFASGTLTKMAGGPFEASQIGLVDGNNGSTFGLTSAATGFSEDISWNPTSGKALLNLTNTTAGTTFSTSLGYINPGDTLKVLSSSTIGLFDTSGHEMNGIVIHSDGSQTDTNYNADGSVGSTFNYDANGNLSRSASGGITQYYNTKGQLQAFGETKIDGSGYVYFEQGATLRYTSLQQPVSVSVYNNNIGALDGNVDVTLIAANGQKDEFYGNGSNFQALRNLDILFYQPNSKIPSAIVYEIDATINDAVMDNNGNVTMTTAVQGFGLATTVINANDTASYTLGGDKITFDNLLQTEFDASAAGDNLATGQNIAFTANSVGFSTAAGILDFDPTTGHVGLVASNFSQKMIDIGQINAGDTLQVHATDIDLVDSSNHLLEKATLNSDFTTKVQTFNTDGSVANTLNYDKQGNLLISAMASFAVPNSAVNAPLTVTDVTHPTLASAAH